MTIPVKLPKEVLKLFPTWEYRCPDCSTYVESNISFCPNCKTAFDEKRWRVPPRFLKSHKTMSKYAHKVLAPKLTPKQRESLFRYFTELFSDGFESGDFIAWTGTSGNPSVVGSPVHHGSYAAEFSAAAWSWEGAYKAFTEQDTIFVRFYIRWASVPSGLGRVLRFEDQTPYTVSVDVLINDSTFRIRDVVNSTNYDYSWSPDADTWYCIEVKAAVDTADAGELRGWLDGSEVITQTGLDLSGTAGIDRVYVGQYGQGGAITNYVDCVVVADTYIGPESMEQTYTKTWVTDVLFKKLGIAKTLNVDVAFRKQNIPKTLGLDSTFQKSFVTQKQVDVLFKKLDILETFGLDVYFGPAEAETCMRDFALDAIFAYKVRLPELWLDENGKLVLNISKPYTWVGT